MILFGVLGVASSISPIDFLQTLIVFSTTCTASTFVAAALMMAYWRRATAAGTTAAMLCGAGTILALFIGGWFSGGSAFQPYLLFGLEPIVWGLAVSAVAGVVVSLATAPPPNALVSRLFDAPASA
jgi:Na+/proline symporter